MLLSHSKKYIYIHVYKVAGTSIKYSFAQTAFYDKKHTSILDRIRVFLGIYPDLYSADFEAHISASELKRKIPSTVFDTYFKFSFVRNPYDWLTSNYEYILQNKTHYLYEEIIKLNNFKEFIYWTVKNHKHYQKEMLVDSQNNILVDFVGKYENLQADINEICKRLQIPPIEMLHYNKSKDKSYKEYYDQELANLVYAEYEPDFKLFDYPKMIV